MPFTPLRRALPVFCLLIVGCMEDHGEPPCDLWTASAVVSGRVTNASGAAIANTAVDVQIASAGPCVGTLNWIHTEHVTTDASGNYSAQLQLGNWKGDRCVNVTAVASGTSEGGQVEFVGGCNGPGPPGQLTVDLVVP